MERPSVSADRKRIKVTLSSEELNSLRRIAERRGVTLSQLVRGAVRSLIEGEGSWACDADVITRTLERLESMMEREWEVIRDLRAELSEVRERVTAVESRLSELTRLGVTVTPLSFLANDDPRDHVRTETGSERVVSSFEDGTLPSFIRDNPWVEILSRKGRTPLK